MNRECEDERRKTKDEYIYTIETIESVVQYKEVRKRQIKMKYDDSNMIYDVKYYAHTISYMFKRLIDWRLRILSNMMIGFLFDIIA